MRTPCKQGTRARLPILKQLALTGYSRPIGLRVIREDWLADAHRPPAAAVPLVTAQPSLRVEVPPPMPSAFRDPPLGNVQAGSKEHHHDHHLSIGNLIDIPSECARGGGGF